MWKNRERDEITVWDICETLGEVQFHDEDVFYYKAVLDEEEKLQYQAVDVSTMEVLQVPFPDVFREEALLGVGAGNSYCHVITDKAAYTFNAKLALLKRTPWPAALQPQVEDWTKTVEMEKKEEEQSFWYNWDINPSGTAIVYSDISSSYILKDSDLPEEMDSSWDITEYYDEKDYQANFLWNCTLEPGAVPQKIVPSVPFFGNYYTRERYVISHFITEEYFLLKNWGWEWMNGWEIWNMKNQRLYNSFLVSEWAYWEYPSSTIAEDAYGLFMNYPHSLQSNSSFYFDYETLQLERFPLFSYPPYNGSWDFTAIKGRTCFFAMATEDALRQTKRIDFFRCDLDTMVVEPLPLTLHNVDLIRAGLVPGERILFIYGDRKSKQYEAGIVQCP